MRIHVFVFVLWTWGCVQSPDLSFDNPCDPGAPASDAACGSDEAAPAEDARPDAGPDAAGPAAPDAAVGVDRGPVFDSGPDRDAAAGDPDSTVDAAPQAPGALGARCASGGDCASGICVTVAVGEPGVCSRECGPGDPCPAGFACVQGRPSLCLAEPDVGVEPADAGLELPADMGPDVVDEGVAACQGLLDCFNGCADGDQDCTNECFRVSPPLALERYNAIIDCLQGNGCFDFNGDLDLECYFTECRDEAVGCFGGGIPGAGDATCGDFLTCVDGCPPGDGECQSACVDDTTVEGYLLYDDALTCVNENNCMDAACQQAFCGDALAACHEHGVVFGPGACGGLLDCALDCIDAAGDVPGCLDGCRAAADRDANRTFERWVDCVNDNRCGDLRDCPACGDDEATCRADRPALPACRDPDADTAALPAGALSAPWGPMSRVVDMRIPSTPEEAAELGCDLVGQNLGTGMSSMIGLAMMDLDAMVQPDESGEIALVLLSALDGWGEGQTGSGAGGDGRAALNLYIGEQGPDGAIRISAESFGDDGALVNRFPDAQTTCGELRTAPADFRFPVAIDAESSVDMSLVSASIRADLLADPDGFATGGGTLQGYLTRETLVEMTTALKRLCEQEGAPAFCDQVNQLLAGDDVEAIVEDIMAPILRGYDARVDADGAVHPCVDECDAISVCVWVQGAGQRVAEVAP